MKLKDHTLFLEKLGRVQPLQHHHQPSRDHRAVSRRQSLCRHLAPMPGVFPDYPAPVVRNTDTGRELSNGMDAPPI
jgi:hypothetical protein